MAAVQVHLFEQQSRAAHLYRIALTGRVAVTTEGGLDERR
jgi:hypothetical protein